MASSPQATAAAAAHEPTTQKTLFVVTNVSELVERLAYYGIVALNVLYLSARGYPPQTIGLLSAILLPLPYVWPILTGAIAEKVGYKPTMLTAFCAYAGGFLLMATATSLGLLVTGILLLGLGAGMFKPLTAATIAHVTSLKDRSFGYNLYYVGINIGGLLGPIVAALLVPDGASAATTVAHSRLGFRLGAAAMFVDFLLILFLFRNPVAPNRQKNVLQALAALGQALKDTRFVVLLALFSGFWILYAMNFTFLTPYLNDFVGHPSWFAPQLQQAIDPALVVLLALPIERFTKRFDGVRMMSLGIALSAAGFLILGFIRTFPALVVGIGVSTLGEILAYPGFLILVSRIAPRDKVAVYQGYGFLPIFAGFLVGPIVGGYLYAWLAATGRTALFWAIMSSIGVLTAAAFVLMARQTRPPAERRRAPLALALALIVSIPLFVTLAAALPSLSAPQGSHEVHDASFFATTDTLSEGQSRDYRVDLPPNAADRTSFRVTWSDEGPGVNVPGAANQPDRFRLTVLAANGTELGSQEASNMPGAQGQAEVALPVLVAHGALTLRVTLVDAGDTVLAGQTVAPDTGNAFHLEALGQAAA